MSFAIISNQKLYIYVYSYTDTMAKTIMIANNVYEELKEVKKDRSFSETIKELIDKSKPKTGSELKNCLGLLSKDDKEYEKIMKELRPLYRKWTQRYA